MFTTNIIKFTMEGLQVYKAIFKNNERSKTEKGFP